MALIQVHRQHWQSSIGGEERTNIRRQIQACQGTHDLRGCSHSNIDLQNPWCNQVQGMSKRFDRFGIDIVSYHSVCTHVGTHHLPRIPNFALQIRTSQEAFVVWCLRSSQILTCDSCKTHLGVINAHLRVFVLCKSRLLVCSLVLGKGFGNHTSSTSECM